MKHSDRAKTINAQGEIVPKPYGPSRWASPRRYGCVHPGCDRPAAVTAASGTHDVDGPGTDRTHNCCGQPHEISS